ncbi:hypothetical protein MJL22_29165, partial [Salmonella enterica subsp. enterica serovar Montevideo]|nr:hypothetical protein [Salmonella enterica subsp. enterica serovar Montevideo]
PNKPEGVADSAFIKTVSGRNFLVALRLYGTEDGFYDQTWDLRTRLRPCSRKSTSKDKSLVSV